MAVHQLKAIYSLFLSVSFFLHIYVIYNLCAFREVAKAVARIIALALDLEVDFFDKPEMPALDLQYCGYYTTKVFSIPQREYMALGHIQTMVLLLSLQ
ncbi:hypothetical protein Q3G72_032206 [Acer saccharum]|nr:hypothetical protein Q3G72_032206 [Acer saccharum]